MTINSYEKKIVAFVDILGWGNSSKDSSQYVRLRTTVKKIADYAKSFSKERKEYLKDTPRISQTLIQEHACIEFSFFSDSFVISAPVDNYGKKIFEILSWASHELIGENFLVRGGVTIGDLHHCDGTIFGPALVEAVRLEKEAVYPCLLCGGEELEKYLKRTDCKEIAVRDRCNKLVVNIALGTLSARDDLMKIIDEKLFEKQKFTDVWQLLTTELPKKYETLDTDDLRPCIEKGLIEINNINDKWRYLHEILPKMYEVRSIKY